MFRAYLDNPATTPVDKRVLEVMMGVLEGPPGNPHAAHHPFGALAEGMVHRAAETIGGALGVKGEQVVFVPSATVANNLAILGYLGRRAREGKGHVLVSAIEHISVLEAASEMRRRGLEVEEIRVGSDGVVDPDEVRKRLRKDTLLVSVMAVNNEIGTVQPIREIAEVVKESKALFHCDAAQACGRIPLQSVAWADIITLSSHKAYGPAGVAALVLPKDRRPSPLIFGGGQQGGVWPGTLPVALAVGMAEAVKIGEAQREQDLVRVSGLSHTLEEAVMGLFPGSRRNGRAPLPYIMSITFEGVDGETVVSRLAQAGIAVSMGSACSKGPAKPSHVLTAIGLRAEEARRTVRFGPGRFTSPQEIAYTVEVLRELAEGVGGRGKD